jgi:tRNA(fMet)-specific endonuclease VapC
MIYMLDADVCIYAINKQPLSYFKRLEQLESKYTIAISSIVLSELQYGVANSKCKEKNQTRVNIFVSKLEVMDFSAKCALFYGELRASLKKKGIIIGGNDLLIASHALSEKAVLVTNNTSEFSRIKGLVLENWDKI